ncbi:hypothetical protein Caci_1704 [Catenulispora acidiphila DSM 44928]|uniref:Uncharacterized protein n=1 Tax=Catenulispora acidiphila (strain DSM 44928 / JCM 14897 / NBRC 102108 / NRRL B-24433 / ID139908) TaxID=479433 RepID=C7QBP8_CATAD|nr:hypothetical protein [Catenulispora acidiphila]ACU70625.1 hypothetical protein Caci_1704 [Catenulispora acidiphila DSM 44928]
MRSAEEIREHAIDGLNHALKRPAMYGGWPAVWPYQDTLSYIDESSHRFEIVDGHARNPMGFVDESLSDPDESFFQALFIPHYHALGWFRPDAVLDPVAHKAFLDGLDLWLVDPHTRAEVLELLGPPSWKHSEVIAYVTADPADPALVLGFHDDIVASAWTSEGRFPAGLRLTPAGKERLASRSTP